MENLDPLDEDELSFLQENEDIDADEEAEEEDFMNNDEVTEDEVDDRREGEAQTYKVLSDNDNEEEENEKVSNKVAQTSRYYRRGWIRPINRSGLRRRINQLERTRQIRRRNELERTRRIRWRNELERIRRKYQSRQRIRG